MSHEIERKGTSVTLRDRASGFSVTRTYSDGEAARRGVRRLETSEKARERFWTNRAVGFKGVGDRG